MPRAVIADVLGPISNYSLRRFTPRPLGPTDVRIAVRAAGVSFVDVLVAAGQYQAKPALPFTPGSECAGIVEAVGSDVSNVSVGQSVIGSGWVGMYADVATLPARSVWPMPSSLSFEEAAVFAVSYATALHALVDRARLQPGETLLVLGAGGATGYAAVQIGAHIGARVIASASSEAKRVTALGGGANRVVDARSPSWRDDVKDANAGKGIDVVFDPVGGGATETAFRTLGWDGRHLIVGFPAGIGALATNLPLLKSASLVGVNLSQLAVADPERAHANHIRALALADKGLRPIIARAYPLARFARAMEDASQGESAGRIVLTMP